MLPQTLANQNGICYNEMKYQDTIVPIEPAFKGEESMALLKLYEALSPSHVAAYLDQNPGIEAKLNCQSKSYLIQPPVLRDRASLEKQLDFFRLQTRAAVSGIKVRDTDSLPPEEYDQFHAVEHDFEYPSQAFANIVATGSSIEMQVAGEQGTAVWRIPLENAAMNICRWFKPASMSSEKLHEAIASIAEMPDDQRPKSTSIYTGVGVLTMMLNPKTNISSATARFPMYEYRVKEFNDVNAGVASRVFKLYERLKTDTAKEHEDATSSLIASTKKQLCGVCAIPAKTESTDTLVAKYPVDAYATVTVFEDYIEVSAATDTGVVVWKLPYPFVFDMGRYEMGIEYGSPIKGMDEKWMQIFESFKPVGMDAKEFMKLVYNKGIHISMQKRHPEVVVPVFKGFGKLMMSQYHTKDGREITRFPMQEYIQPMFPEVKRANEKEESTYDDGYGHDKTDPQDED